MASDVDNEISRRTRRRLIEIAAAIAEHFVATTNREISGDDHQSTGRLVELMWPPGQEQDKGGHWSAGFDSSGRVDAGFGHKRVVGGRRFEMCV